MEQAEAAKNRVAVGEAEWARMQGVSVWTVRKLRVEGGGAPFVRLGRRVVYPVETALRWLDEKAVRSTSEATERDRAA